MILPLQISIHSYTKIRANAINKEILDCYACTKLFGKFRIEPLHNPNIFHVVLILPHVSLSPYIKVKQLPFIEIHFPQKFPLETVNVHLHVSNSQNEGQSIIYTPNQQKNKLKDIIHEIYQKIQNKFHSNCQFRETFVKESKECFTKSGKSIQTFLIEDQISQDSSQLKQNQDDLKNSDKKKLKKPISKSVSLDKQLTQTKNLNRHFRSKLRQVYKDIMITQKESADSLYIQKVFAPNRVGFQDIRNALKNEWFNKAVKKQISSGRFLHKILRGMMGVKSKLLMIKYYHVMACAVQNPQSFIRWKYQ